MEQINESFLSDLSFNDEFLLDKKMLESLVDCGDCEEYQLLFSDCGDCSDCRCDCRC